jgi:hypothetical protein
MNSFERVTDKHIRYYTNLKNQLDIHETKARSIQFRKNVLERQKVNNYNNELDRIRGELSNTVLRGNSREHLIKRRIELTKLGATATGS